MLRDEEASALLRDEEASALPGAEPPPDSLLNDQPTRFYSQLLCVSAACCATFCVGCMLVWAQAILKPLVFSAFLVYVISPLVRVITTPVTLPCRAGGRYSRHPDELEGLMREARGSDLGYGMGVSRAHSSHSSLVAGVRVACPDWLAIMIVLAALFTALSLLVNAFASGCSSLQENFPVYRAELLAWMEAFTRWLERVEPRAKDVLVASLQKWVRELPFPSIMEDTVTAIVGGLESLVLVLLFTLYLLQDPKGLSQLLIHEQIDRQLRRYVALKTLVCLAVGLFSGFVFSLVAPPLAFLVGLLTFVANYIPFLGLVATILPMPLLLLDPSMSGGARAFAFLLPLAAHMVVANYIEPKVFGRTMELHPVVVLLSLAFWGALWGVMGCLLAIPLTIALRIVFAHWRSGGTFTAGRSDADRGGR